MGRVYIKEIRKGLHYSFFDVKAWYEGESDELKRILGFGFYNTIFVVKNRNVEFYYDEEECDRFYEILDEKLEEDFFNNLCDGFFELIEASNDAETNAEIFEIMVKCWSALVIFNELSLYPEYGNDFMLRRLVRVRKTTEAFSYELSKRLNLKDETPESYLFFRGELIEKPFEKFLDEMDFIVKNE